MKWSKIPKKAWVSIVCFVASLTLIPVALTTYYTIILVASSVLSGFGWGIVYALPSSSDNKTKGEQS